MLFYETKNFVIVYEYAVWIGGVKYKRMYQSSSKEVNFNLSNTKNSIFNVRSKYLIFLIIMSEIIGSIGTVDATDIDPKIEECLQDIQTLFTNKGHIGYYIEAYKTLGAVSFTIVEDDTDTAWNKEVTKIFRRPQQWGQYPDIAPNHDKPVLVLFRDEYYLGFYSYKDQEFYIKAERGYNAIEHCKWQELPPKNNESINTDNTIQS